MVGDRPLGKVTSPLPRWVNTTKTCTGDGINTYSMVRPGTYCETPPLQQHCPCSDVSYGQTSSEPEPGIKG